MSHTFFTNVLQSNVFTNESSSTIAISEDTSIIVNKLLQNVVKGAEGTAAGARGYINMDFLGLDLSSVPTADMSDFKTLIIPFLYVVSSIVSMKMTLNMQQQTKQQHC